MNKIASLVLVVSSLTLMSHEACADGSIKIRGGVSNNSYEMDYTPVNGSSTTFATTSYNGTNLGVTFLFGDAYLDIAGSSGSGTYQRPLYAGDLQRTDASLILGMNFGSMSSIVGNYYLGFKTGETKLDPPGSAPTGSSHLDFTASGMVFGGGLGFPINEGKAGLFGLSLGIGVMGANYTQQNVGSAATTATADTAYGVNYGLMYTFPFTENFGGTLDYKNTSYAYTFNSGLSNQIEYDEKVSSTVASLYLRF